MNSSKSGAGAQHPPHFGDGVDRALDVLEDEAGEGGVKAFIGKRQGRRRSPRVVDAGRASGPLAASIIPGRFVVPSPGRLHELRARRVDAGHAANAGQAGRHSRELALAAADVEDGGRRRFGEEIDQERDDLLPVLGVGPLGEALLPPGGVDLPELLRLDGQRLARVVR